MIGTRNELADDRRTRDLTRDEKTPGRLGICEEQCVDLLSRREIGARPDPVEVAPCAAADVSRLRRSARTIQVRHGGGVDDRGDSTGPGQLEEVAEQSEPR